MITLPENWQDLLQISPSRKEIFLHLVNQSGQFYTYYYRLDPAFPLDRVLEEMAAKLTASAGNDQAYTLEADLEITKSEPSDQSWEPAPLPASDIISITMYRAMNRVPSAEQPKADPIPGPTSGDVD